MSDAAPEIAVLRAALAAAEARASAAERELTQARAVVSASEEMIQHLRLQIARLRRDQYGHSAERHARLLEQLELRLEDLETDLADDLTRTTTIAPTTASHRCRAQATCPQAVPRTPAARTRRHRSTGGLFLLWLGTDREDGRGCHRDAGGGAAPVEGDPDRPREVHPARDCERISQPPAPFHPTPRGWAGPNLLAMMLFEKFGQHQPLNRQAERHAKEGVEISLSTLADQVGACALALQPIHDLIRTHVLGAERLHADDTTVPLLAKGGTGTARLWTYLRDDRPFRGGAPPAALHYFSTDRRMEHPTRHLEGWTGTLQADAYGGYNDLYRAGHKPAR